MATKKTTETEETKTLAKNAFYHYDFDLNGNRIIADNWKPWEIKQDSIVDYGSFRPDNEEERMFRLTGEGSSGDVGKYDDKNIPSDLVVKIRQGKLDKAEVQQVIESKKAEFKETQDEMKAEQAKEIAEARQEFLDKATGFEGKPKES